MEKVVSRKMIPSTEPQERTRAEFLPFCWSMLRANSEGNLQDGKAEGPSERPVLNSAVAYGRGSLEEAYRRG